MRGSGEAYPIEDTVSVRETILTQAGREQQQQQPYDRANVPVKFYILSRKQYPGKRLMDLAVGGLGMIVLALLYPFIALGIKLSSRGPVIFKQKRTGLNGFTFTCYKFRTMHPVDIKRKDGQPDITRKNDVRIFRFGSLLRKLNLDELPQLINIMKGEMSLVGPRPYPLEECAYWNSTFDDFFYRYAVRPGLSGWAQVSGFRGGTLDKDHMQRRLTKDLAYVQKQSLRLDLMIIWKTLLQMVHLNTNGH